MNDNIKNLLNQINNESLDTLKKVYMILYPNRSKNQTSKMKTETIINKLEKFSEEEIKEAYIQAKGKIPTNKEIDEVVTKQINPELPQVSLNNLATMAQAKATQSLNSLLLEVRKHQTELLDVTITPRFPTKMNGRDQVETVSIHNQFGSIGKIVPFGKVCELERCIVEYFQNAKCIQVAADNHSKIPFMSGNIEGTITPMSNYGYVPKYIVTIHPKGTVRAQLQQQQQQVI